MPEHASFDLDGPDEPAGEEVLAGGGWPRWAWPLVIVCVVGVVAALLVTHGGNHPGATRHSTPPSVPTSTPSYGPPPPVALDVAVGPSGAWVLDDDALLVVAGARTLRRIPLPELAGVTPDATARLLLDPAAPLLWIAVEDGVHARLIEFGTDPLRKLRDVTWAEPLVAAAAYRGHVYVTTDLGAADLAPGAARPVYIPGLSPAVGPIAVDPSRHRIVLMDQGYPTDVWTYRPGGRPIETTDPLPFGKGSIAVVDGAIWAGGYAQSGAVLERLDPATLRPVARSPQQARFDPGAVVAGAGARVLWVRSEGPYLWCVNATDGRIAQTFLVPTNVNGVASDRSGAVVASDGGAVELVLSGCPG